MRRSLAVVFASLLWLACGGDDIDNPFVNPIDGGAGRGGQSRDGASDGVAAGGNGVGVGGAGGRAGSAGSGVAGGGAPGDGATPDGDETVGAGGVGGGGSSGAGGVGGSSVDAGAPDVTDAGTGDQTSQDASPDASRDALLDVSIVTDGGSVIDVASEDRASIEPGCSGPNECPAPANECLRATCVDGGCGTAPVQAGTAVADQVAGNCKKKVCNGSGGTQDQNDDSNVADDSNACTLDGCNAGTPTHVARTGEGCGNAGICSAAGQCVGCIQPADCPGTDDFCKTRTCALGTCGWSYTGIGVAFPMGQQVAGDCKTRTCDGQGHEVAALASSDRPVDSNQCTKDLCTGTTPSNPSEAPGTSCSSGGGHVCDGAGECVECLTPAICGTPAGSPCVVATCGNDHHCGTANAAPATACGAGASCSNGSQHAADTCSGGACVSGADGDCAPYACGASACKTECSGDEDCATGNVCDTGLKICVATGTPKCTDYCDAIESACTGANAQYDSHAACLRSCAPLPRGASSDAGGQSVGCRITHAGYAVGDPVSHCPHTGPSGDGVCGATCDSFCTIAAAVCTGQNQQFASMDDCMTACNGFPVPDRYTVPVATGNTFACRLYHLTLASVDPVTHCPHIPTASSVCTGP